VEVLLAWAEQRELEVPLVLLQGLPPDHQLPPAQQRMPQNMQSLVDAMKDFSSAEILIALMLSNASGGKDDEKSGGSAAAGFLAGLAMAGGLAQGGDINLSVEVAGAQPPAGAGGAGGAGLGLNVSV